jgi:hypothetical protein
MGTPSPGEVASPERFPLIAKFVVVVFDLIKSAQAEFLTIAATKLSCLVL